MEQAANRAFIDAFNDIILVAAIIAFTGAVLALLLIRSRDLAAPARPPRPPRRWPPDGAC